MDDGADIPREMVAGIYERIQQRELRSNEDHVTYVSRVEQSILGLKTVSSFYFVVGFFFAQLLALAKVSLPSHIIYYFSAVCLSSVSPVISISFPPLLCRSLPCRTGVWCAAVACLRCLMPTSLINRNCPSSNERSFYLMTCCW